MLGRTVSHYQIVDELGAGGMGVVYRAIDTRLRRQVALKLLPPDKAANEERRRRFLQEARSASALNHPGIVTIYDILHEDGLDVLVMELVEGQTLLAAIPKSGLPIAEAVAIGRQIAAALGAAHNAGIVHRDLKPGNVMISTPAVPAVAGVTVDVTASTVPGSSTAPMTGGVGGGSGSGVAPR